MREVYGLDRSRRDASGAKACGDLSVRKVRGEQMSFGDLKKYKKETFRLVHLFGPDAAVELVDSTKLT